MVTPDQIAKATGATLMWAQNWSGAINDAMIWYDIDSPARQAAFLAQIGEEIVGPSREKYLSGPRPEKIGVVSGDLRRSVNYKVNDNRVVIGSNLPYAAIQEFGGIIVPKNAPRLRFKLLDGGWRSSMRVVIPARPYLATALRDSIAPSIGIIQRLADQAMKEALA